MSIPTLICIRISGYRFFVSGLAACSGMFRSGPARSGSIETLSLGFQRTGIPLVARELTVFERRFEPKGIKVNWVEFTSGLNLLQAMDLGNFSFGNAGNVGCLFVGLRRTHRVLWLGSLRGRRARESSSRAAHRSDRLQN